MKRHITTHSIPEKRPKLEKYMIGPVPLYEPSIRPYESSYISDCHSSQINHSSASSVSISDSYELSNLSTYEMYLTDAEDNDVYSDDEPSDDTTSSSNANQMSHRSVDRKTIHNVQRQCDVKDEQPPDKYDTSRNSGQQTYTLKDLIKADFKARLKRSGMEYTDAAFDTFMHAVYKCILSKHEECGGTVKTETK
mmetsp:Transcript_5496/g.8374  ORF Transcript_5496/g.8374 Transcript_5496/m.8374 type:complete len:194 (+) Transcript_5496:70-651(+)|eukprot:CAMPEP_0185031522 /NCGR_PEP_ID=MMETSP1103-20130426/19038_1 /TAXON_ID=36769 /ORGANISM="Paraphysomonas bandaiensis, Strain Caron Lab Isolate" /LENGTH=193 /DNA_ID=CAMNT_0027567067 /DNA_START=45 /DNA_END=626 /DNA_ORIENTATION=-